MERGDAESIFALLAGMDGDLRGWVVSQRWLLIWIVWKPMVEIPVPGLVEWAAA